MKQTSVKESLKYGDRGRKKTFKKTNGMGNVSYWNYNTLSGPSVEEVMDLSMHSHFRNSNRFCREYVFFLQLWALKVSIFPAHCCQLDTVVKLRICYFS